MSQIPDDEGLLPGGATPDETTQGAVVSGPSGQPVLGAPEPLEKWSDEDPEFIEFVEQEEDSETDEPEELTAEELEAEPLESDPLAGPQWVRYELWAQNLDDETDWVLMATEDVDGENLEAEVGQIPTATRMRFRLRLIDANGQASKWSEAVDITTPRDLTAPPPPFPPVVTDVNGFITFSTDGALTGETPPDLSHLPLYIQQMHPAGDPDGEPGDPVRLTDFRPNGGHLSTGHFQDRVEHRAFLTAVDTSSNESPRSEYVYFTPEDPVDREAIQEELDKVEGRLGEDLDQKITDGLDGIYAELDDREESVVDRAKREAAEDAQVEYDRLQELAENALQATNPNIIEDPSFETDIWDEILSGDVSEGETGTTDPTMVNRETGWAHTGDYALVFGPGPVSARLLAGIQVEERQIWRLSAWVSRASGVGDGFGTLVLQRAAGGLYEEVNLVEEVPADDQWHQVVMDAEIPEGVDALEVALYWGPSDSTLLAIDDLRLGNATSHLRDLWDAREAAQEAHEQAGKAEDLAQQAMDAAGRSNRIHSSTSAPSGTANDGDMWYMWSSTGADRTLEGIWTYEDGNWQSMGTLDAQMIPILDIGQGTAGQLDVERINGLAAQFRRLHVGGGDNLLPIEALEDFRDNGGESPDWYFQHGGEDKWTVITGQGGMELVLRRNDGVHDGLASRLFYSPNGEGIRTQEGEQFRLTFYGWQSGSGETDGAQSWVRAYFWDRHGDYVAFGSQTFFESGWNNYTHHITVPEGTERMDILFQSASGAPRGHWGDFDLRRMNDGQLTVDGSVKARALDVQDFAADEARMEVMWAGMGNFLEASVDNLFVNQGEFRRIRGAEIEGVRMVGSEVMTSEDWASSGGAIVRQDGTYGNVVTANEDGDVTARLGGGRNELRGVDVDGDITARSMNLSGELRVGGNGEGGIIPAGDRTRFIGRTPATTGPTDTMAYGRTGQIIPPTSRVNLRVTYETPTPTSARVPITGIHIGSDANPQALPTTATQNRSASGFNIRVQYMKDWPFWVYYTAFWGDPPNSPGSIEAG